MNVDFYSYAGEDIRLDKSLGNHQVISGHLVDGCDILNPVIKFSDSAALRGMTLNYAHIADFGRYYYRSGAGTIENGCIYIPFHVDVLKTYSSQIKNCKARITRSQSNFDKYIQDNLIINTVDTKIDQRKIGNGFSRSEKYYVLIAGALPSGGDS